MPSDWIRGKFDEEEKRKAEDSAREEKQAREAALIRALGPAFVENLRSAISDDIVEWNKRASADRKINGTDRIPNGFTIDKPSFPRGFAHVKSNPDTLRIEVCLTRSQIVEPYARYDSDGYFYLKANPDGQGVHMEDRFRNSHVAPAGFSRIILESIADQHSQHSI